MGDELLKKTGSGNLFMVFGEPDVEIRKGENGKLTVEIKGVDVYDPTTGVIRSDSTDDIACWFIDTNYNAESFFVATRISPARIAPTRSCRRSCAPRSTKTPGRRCIPPSVARSIRKPARSPSR
jgi:hypothetical protein